MNKKKLEISSIHALGGWNNSYGTAIELSIPIDQFGEDNTHNDTYKPVRIDLADLLVFLNKTNPDYEIVEPAGNRKYIYVRPIPKGGKK